MNSRPIIAGLTLILAASGPVSWLVSTSAAQTAWSWPDSAKNLKVLPRNTSKQKLRAVMIGFSRALDVDCSHCHKGKEGEPLSTYDFASDENPKKNIARGMLNMLGSINDQLKQIQPDVPDRVNMWCHTCHRGVARPRTLVEELSLVHAKTGADSALSRYRGLRAAHDNSGAYDFREPALNELGRGILAKGDLPGAIAVFRANAERFPAAASPHDALAEAHLATGDTASALSEYERSLRLDPEGPRAKTALETLRARR